jgi:hypothetical protein
MCVILADRAKTTCCELPAQISGQFSRPLVDQSPEKLRKAVLSEAVLSAMSSFRTIWSLFAQCQRPFSASVGLGRLNRGFLVVQI